MPQHEMHVRPSANDLEALRRILGAEGVVTDPDQRRGYEIAARYGEGLAAAVLRPASTEQVSLTLAFCATRGLHVIPQSGNTGLVLGSTPDASGADLVLSLERMRRVIEVSPDNRSITAEAGVRLSQINAALEPEGLWLPIDLGADPMIGGMVATNTGGARFLRYGDVRTHVLGVELVLANPDATVVQLGSGLRKDNARLHLKDLVVGSCGLLGVVTQATLAVHPRALQTAAALLTPSGADRSLDILRHFEQQAYDYLSAFEGMSGAAMRHALALPHMRSPFRDKGPDYAILVELSTGSPASLVDLDDILLALLSPLSEGERPALADAIIARPSDLWRLRHALSEGLKSAGQVIGFDLSFRRDRVLAFRAEAVRQLAGIAPNVQVCDFGHLADGGVHFNLVAPQSLTRPEIERIREMVLDLAVDGYGGSFSGEHGLGRINHSAYERHVPVAERTLSNSVAKAFDPHGLGATQLDGPAAGPSPSAI